MMIEKEVNAYISTYTTSKSTHVYTERIGIEGRV